MLLFQYVSLPNVMQRKTIVREETDSTGPILDKLPVSRSNLDPGSLSSIWPEFGSNLLHYLCF